MLTAARGAAATTCARPLRHTSRANSNNTRVLCSRFIPQESCFKIYCIFLLLGQKYDLDNIMFQTCCKLVLQPNKKNSKYYQTNHELDIIKKHENMYVI